MIKKTIDYFVKSGLKGDLCRMARKIYKKIGTLKAEYTYSREPIPFNEKDNYTFKPIKVGATWSKDIYGCAWFHFTGEVPDGYDGEKLACLVSVEGEGAVVDKNGNPLKATSRLSAFVEFMQPSKGKRYLPLESLSEDGKNIDFYFETGNNVLPPNNPYTIAKLAQCDIVVVREDIRDLYYDVMALTMQKYVVEKGSEKYVSIGTSVRDAMRTAGDFAPEKVAKAREILQAEMENGEDSEYTFYATGHAHLDLAWLWPIRETQRKAGRTFSNQLYNVENYDGYIFGASQPQQFEWMEEKYPALFARLKKAIDDGKVEPQGGMWVECDTNVTSGEALIRQNLYGTRYWKEKFGKTVRTCWLPDVFGFSGNLPQIIKKCGMDSFLTIKLSWNEHNKFPHRTFVWEGIDDSQVLVHMPPEETYNSEGHPWGFDKAFKNFPEKNVVKDMGCLFGIGDGGGGPGEAHIELVKRAGVMKEMPKVKMAPSTELFNKLDGYKSKLAVHKGELYLEKHQGTYTTQSKNKYYNRKTEFALHNTEFLSTCALNKGFEYPKEILDKVWKEVLLYQFHDIIPGSSIKRVYDESVARYEQMNEELLEVQNKALATISTGKRLTAINPNSYRVKDIIYRGDKWYTAEVAPYSSAPLKEYQGEHEVVLRTTENSIENDIFVVKFDSYGNIKSLFDKRYKKDFGDKFYLNKLNVYKDKRLYYNAWDIDINYTKRMPSEFKLIDHDVKIEKGAVIRENMYKYGHSSISQKVILYIGKPIVDFVMTVDWQETHKMLRADFRPSVFADEVTCDIQMGNLKRSTKNDNKYEKAQYEICAHKWIDLSDGEYGLSFITEGKYGWRVKEGLVSLNLLRSPMYPAPDADKGTHTLRYALYPHAGDYNEAETQSVAYAYNNKLIITEEEVDIPSFATTDDTHVVIETIKRAESGDGVVIRAYEDTGAKRKVDINLAQEYKEAYETDMLENVIGEVSLKGVEFKPFEIKTFLIK